MSYTLRNFAQLDLSKSLALKIHDEISSKITDDTIEVIEYSFNTTDIYIKKVASEVKLKSVVHTNEDAVILNLDDFLSALKYYFQTGKPIITNFIDFAMQNQPSES